MTQIKTVVSRIDNAENFDTQVNKYLKDGWSLKRRYLSTPRQGGTLNYYRMLIAELVKEDTKAISEVQECQGIIVEIDYDKISKAVYEGVKKGLLETQIVVREDRNG